jgi:YHS domain-containing protein/ferredoxin
MPIDPICKKMVDEKTEFKSVYKNKEHFFCSENCKNKFDELDKSVIRVKRTLSDRERISFGKLKREIIDPGICTMCGACVASCEVFTAKTMLSDLKGLELFKDAEDRGYIKIEPLERQALDKVLHPAKAKKAQMYMIKKRFETGKGL